MPYFRNGNANIYYEDVGKGNPIITNHGLSEDTSYWSEPGITAALAEKYRVISMDMRCHGRTTVEGEPRGMDEVTLGNDITALADYLKIEKFHLLSHATGGIVAARYGIRHSDRLLSLLLTDTSSSTYPKMYHPDGRKMTREELEASRKQARQNRLEMEKNPPVPPSFTQRRAAWRANPNIFTFKMVDHPYSDHMFEIMDNWNQRRRSDLSEFGQHFYVEPDFMIEGLRQIKCPTLLLVGEFDYVFLEPTKLMAKEIPDNRLVVMRGCGHMTALEAPKWTAHEILDFLECVEQTGHAK